MQASIAFPANHLVAVVLLGQDSKRGLNDTTSQTKHQVKGGLLLYVVVRQGSAIFQLFASKNESLLIWGDAFFVLDFGLYIVNCV